MAEEEKPDVIVENKKGKPVLILILIVIAFAIAGGLFALYRSGVLQAPSSVTEEEIEKIATEAAATVEEVMVATEEAEATDEAEATQSADSLTPVELNQENEAELIKLAVLQEMGLNEEEVAFTITENTGTYAKGNIREIDAVGGGYWLAVKDKGKWILVYEGQANPSCEDVDEFDFPADMVPECMDNNDQVVTR